MSSVDGTIELNLNNFYSNGGYNNQYVYNFTNTIDFTGMEIALLNANFFNSIANVSNSAPLSNNTFQVEFPYQSGSGQPYLFTVNVPPGIYGISDLNSYINLECTRLGLYLIPSSTVSSTNTAGTPYFFITLTSNPVYYKCLITTYAIPTSYGNSWTAGTYSTGTAPVWSPTGGTHNMAIIPPSNSAFNTAFGGLIGFGPTMAPSSLTVGNSQTLGNYTPEISPQGIIYICANIIFQNNSPYSTSLYSFQLSGNVASAGSNVSLQPPSPIWKPVTMPKPTQLIISLLDANLNPVSLNDPANNITIGYRRRK
jgi:hypothetical protein